jgi:hypothetical protein
VALSRTVASLNQVDPGYRPEHVTLFQLSPRPGGYVGMDESSYYPELAESVGATPGVQSVAFSNLFTRLRDPAPFLQPLKAASGTETTSVGALVDVVSPEFFQTAGMQLEGGRAFTWSDDAKSMPVAIVNRSLAHRLFGESGAIGQSVQLGHAGAARAFTIVGVVRDATFSSPRHVGVPALFRPSLQEPRSMRRPLMLGARGRRRAARGRAGSRGD